MLRKVLKVLLILGVVLLAGGLLFLALISRDAQAAAGEFPCSMLLEPIRPGEQASRIVEIICSSNEPSEVESAFLEPLKPGEGIPPTPETGDLVNGVVRGPSTELRYRCVVLLEPVQPGESFSKAREPVCSTGPIEAIDGVSLDASYLIARFYDSVDFANPLIEYYGSSACSSTDSYGIADLPDNLDNKFESGRGYSNCDLIHVYDFNNYGGPSYSCGANCTSFHALNNNVSSWRVTD